MEKVSALDYVTMNNYRVFLCLEENVYPVFRCPFIIKGYESLDEARKDIVYNGKYYTNLFSIKLPNGRLMYGLYTLDWLLRNKLSPLDDENWINTDWKKTRSYNRIYISNLLQAFREWKEGEYIICINNKYVEDFLTIGSLYKIEYISKFWDSIIIIDDTGNKSPYYLDHFQPFTGELDPVAVLEKDSINSRTAAEHINIMNYKFFLCKYCEYTENTYAPLLSTGYKLKIVKGYIVDCKELITDWENKYKHEWFNVNGKEKHRYELYNITQLNAMELSPYHDDNWIDTEWEKDPEVTLERVKC